MIDFIKVKLLSDDSVYGINNNESCKGMVFDAVRPDPNGNFTLIYIDDSNYVSTYMAIPSTVEIIKDEEPSEPVDVTPNKQQIMTSFREIFGQDIKEIRF